MNSERQRFISRWRRVWNAKRNTPSEAVEVKDPFPLPDTPAYPLARTVGMPVHMGFKTGALAFRLMDLCISGLSRPEEESMVFDKNGNAISIQLKIPDVRLQGSYALEAKPDPVMDLDTAGTMMEISEQDHRPMAAGAGSGSPDPDPEQEAWLNNARSQRTELSKTENGQKMLRTYYDHNETYNGVFESYPALATVWKAGGATKEMARDTSNAVSPDADSDAVINNSGKTYAGNLTYNGNAFSQQLNVAASCVYSDPDFSPVTGPNKQGKYWEAAKAALSFGKGVSTSTGNSKSSTNAMTKTQVYSTVKDHKDELPTVTNDEVTNAIVESPLIPGGSATVENPDWVHIDEEDRKRLRFLHDAILKQKAEDSDVEGLPVFQGTCHALLGSVSARIRLSRTDENQPYRAECPLSAIEIPAFEFHIDDSQWGGETAEVARNRLERVYFIRSLLYASIADGFQRTLQEAAERSLNL